MLRKIFGPTRAEVTGNWSILHNEDLHDLHSPICTYSGGEIQENEMGRVCGMYE